MPNAIGQESGAGQGEVGQAEPGAGAPSLPVEQHRVPYIEVFDLVALPVEYFELGAVAS